VVARRLNMKIVMLLLGCLLLLGWRGWSLGADFAARVLPPRPVVVAESGVKGFAGLDYVLTVSCAVRNNGGDGPVLVTVTFVQNGTRTRTQNVFLSAGEQRDVTFVFPEAKLLSSRSMRYQCSAS
jgi:hypothetical protein